MTQAVGVILLIITIVGVILVASNIDSFSRRERGLPKKKRKGIRKGNGEHEK